MGRVSFWGRSVDIVGVFFNIFWRVFCKFCLIFFGFGEVGGISLERLGG